MIRCMGKSVGPRVMEEEYLLENLRLENKTLRSQRDELVTKISANLHHEPLSDTDIANLKKERRKSLEALRSKDLEIEYLKKRLVQQETLHKVEMMQVIPLRAKITSLMTDIEQQRCRFEATQYMIQSIQQEKSRLDQKVSVQMVIAEKANHQASLYQIRLHELEDERREFKRVIAELHTILSGTEGAWKSKLANVEESRELWRTRFQALLDEKRKGDERHLAERRLARMQEEGASSQVLSVFEEGKASKSHVNPKKAPEVPKSSIDCLLCTPINFF